MARSTTQWTLRGRRRMVAVVGVASVVAIAGGVAAFAVFDGAQERAGRDPSEAVWTPPKVFTVWPENPLTDETPEAVQAAVDAGDTDLRWRTDPDLVAERFAREVLAWQPKLMLRGARHRGELQGVVSPCGDEQMCASLPRGHEAARIRLVQPARIGPGGVWSVAAFVSRPLAVGPTESHATGEVVAVVAGAKLSFDVHIEPGTSAHLGIVATNGCRSFQELLPGREAGVHMARIPQPPADGACGDRAAGYAFAYVQDAVTVPVGDPLLEAASFVHPWLTIVPLAIVPATEITASESAGG